MKVKVLQKLVAKLGGPSVPEIKTFLCKIAESQGMNQAFVEGLKVLLINLLLRLKNGKSHVNKSNIYVMLFNIKKN